RKVERIVEMIDVDQLASKVQSCIEAGFPYGDFQFNIDDRSKDFLKQGIFSGYKLVDPSLPVSGGGQHMSEEDWLKFVLNAHIDKHATFEQYARMYQASSGLFNWSDFWQTSIYMDNYHRVIDARLHSPYKATEVLTEIYVPAATLTAFIRDVKEDFLKH